MNYARDLVNLAQQRVQEFIRQQSDSGASIASALNGGPSTSGGGANNFSNLSFRGNSDASSMSSGASAHSQALEARVQRFKAELNASHINIHAIKRLAFQGIPDKDNLRAVVWKVLLHYLPCNPEEFQQVMARRRTQYRVFCDELILDPKRINSLHATSPLGGPSVSHAQSSGDEPGAEHIDQHQTVTASSGRAEDAEATTTHEVHDPLRPQDVTSSDHPLSLEQSSHWNVYFQDSEIMAQIERDVVRTHPDMHFFTGDSPEAELHREEMKRALFMYAKLNPGLRYIQGMNELIAPLYYLFKNDPDPMAQQYAEADAFWCFMDLISEFRDHFCQQLDNAETGIRATIRRLMNVLQHWDYELWRHIEVVNKVDPQFYAFRWITLLLAQEFAFPDTLRIWDTILSDPHGRMDCLLRICTAMILHMRDYLMKGDFTVIMKTLQRYPPVDVNILLSKAANMAPCREVLGNPV